MIALFHFVHMIAGVIYGGAALVFAWVVLPALVPMDPDTRIRHFTTLARYAAPFMALIGIVAFFGGIARAWASGMISGFGGLFSGYGLMATLAVLIFIVWGVLDGMSRARLARAISGKDEVALAREVGLGRLITTIGLLLILGLMGAMRLGLY